MVVICGTVGVFWNGFKGRENCKPEASLICVLHINNRVFFGQKLRELLVSQTDKGVENGNFKSEVEYVFED